MAERQSQKAGTNSTQLQVQGDLHVHQGVTEERAVAIAKEQAAIAVRDYAAEASEVGAARIEAFNDRMVPKLETAELLDVFRDPGFQVLLRKAQIGAASSGRESDYDLLAGLLTDRAERGGDRKVVAAVDRAVEVIDLIADDALAGLTVVQAFSQYLPNAGDMGVGLDTLETLYQQLELDDLPTGSDWIDHLDTLGLVRVSQGGVMTRVPSAEFWANRTPGYVCVGVLDTEVEAAVRRHSERSPFLLANIIDHELKPGYKRLQAPYAGAIAELMMRFGTSKEDADACTASLRDNFLIDTPDPSIQGKLHEEAAKRPGLDKIQNWWDALPIYFEASGVGRVIARANAERLDHRKMLPPLR